MQNDGDHYSSISVGTDFKEEPEDTCTIVIQIMTAHKGDFTINPMVKFNIGQ